jgi:hypothetical protein
MRLRIQDHAKIFSFAVTDTRKSDVIIGFNWLKQHNRRSTGRNRPFVSPGVLPLANELAYGKNGRKRTMPT